MRRPCQFCGDPLGRFAKVLHIYTCRNCAYRMSMGTSPRRKDALSAEPPASGSSADLSPS